MITLKLNVSYVNGQSGKFLSVTSDQLEVVPSPGGVCRLLLPLIRRHQAEGSNSLHLQISMAQHWIYHPTI